MASDAPPRSTTDLAANGGRGRFAWVGALAAGLALATAVVLFAFVGQRGADGAARGVAPEYVVESGTDEGGRLRIAKVHDDPFKVVLRPAAVAADAGARVVFYVFAVGEGEPNAVDATVLTAPDGVTFIQGRARMLDGATSLRIVVGTANATITRYEDALAHARDGVSTPQVRVLTLPIRRD